MEVEGHVQPDFHHQDAPDRASEAASACSRTSMEPLPYQLLDEVVRELALMPPVADEADWNYTLKLAARAAGEQSEDGIKALQAAALEWSYRCLTVHQIAKYDKNEELFKAYRDKVASFFEPGTCMSRRSSSAASSSSSSGSAVLSSSLSRASNNRSSSPILPARSSSSSSSSGSSGGSSNSSSGSFGCLGALKELRTDRLWAGGWFKYEAEAEPYRNVYGKSMTADDLLRRIDTEGTHAL